ncbi:hypothetical protein F383_25628 [Gossypium arboreum]|uniref:Uncharacterized protein n=1 Tax=Gossypium arboreum TaxID=29729 RepID=A0A0B0P346_GOSAR|nr:hypothetical protein F383_25628 [Gossypium arboreum]
MRRCNGSGSDKKEAKVITASKSKGKPARIILTFSTSEIREPEASIKAHVVWNFAT